MARMVLKVRIPGCVLNLALSLAITSYMFYGFVRVPPDVEQSDVIFWTYAKAQTARRLSVLGDYLGFGHPAHLYRSIMSYLEDAPPADPTIWSKMNVSDVTWHGVPVRVYEPHNKIRNGPALMLYHGGLWFMGSVDRYDHIAAKLAKLLGIIVASVEYRLAPDHKYPKPFQDCYVATRYLLEHGRRLQIDTSMVALMGVDAGANMAAAVALKLRDRGRHLPTPEYQILVSPLLQSVDFLTPSYIQYGHDAFVPRSLVTEAWHWYGFGPAVGASYAAAMQRNMHTSASAKKAIIPRYIDHKAIPRKYLHDTYNPGRLDFGDETAWRDLRPVLTDPYFAPLMADDLTGLPGCYMVLSQYDVTRDDGLMYAKRLEKANVDVTVKYYPRSVHGHLSLDAKTALADKILTDLVDFLITKF